jgi:hypothetical protein
MIIRRRSARGVLLGGKNELPLGPPKRCVFYKPPPIPKEQKAILKRAKQSLERQMKKLFENSKEDNEVEVNRIKLNDPNRPPSSYSTPLTKKIMTEYKPHFESFFNLNFTYRSIANCLDHHKISSLQRAKMVNWMIEVINTYECSHHTFFLAVDIMDRFYAVTGTSYGPEDLHLTGIVSLLIASKYIEVRQLNVEIACVYLGDSVYSEEMIKKKQECILRTLDFNIWFPTPITIVEYFIERFAEDYKIEKKYLTVLDEIRKECVYLGKLCKYDYDLLKYRFIFYIINSSLVIAKASIYAAIMDVSTKTEKKISEKFIDWIQDLMKDDNNMMQIEKCATILGEVNKGFEHRYSSLINMKVYESHLLK